jgi:hypothetical protein
LRDETTISLPLLVLSFSLRSYSDGCPQEYNSKILKYNSSQQMVSTAPQKSPGYSFSLSLPKYMFLDLARNFSPVLPVRFHILCFITLTWNPRYFPCDFCEADDDVQDEQHAVYSSAET